MPWGVCLIVSVYKYKYQEYEGELHIRQKKKFITFIIVKWNAWILRKERSFRGRLKETVALEYEKVPAYRKRMDEAGVKPEDINSIEDIVKLPFMQKTDLRDNFPYGLFAADIKDMVRIQGSSGTTGKPIVSGYTEK